MANDNKVTRGLTVKPKGPFLLFLRKRDPDRTQKDVEDSTGIPNMRLYLYERGNPIPIDHLQRLSAYYGIPARELTEPDSFEIVLKRTQYLCKVFSMTLGELVNREEAP